MHTSEAIRSRRSVKRYTDRPLSREEIEAVLDAASLAPNHRLTQPWRFYVLGPVAREAYGAALGARKAKKIDDAALAERTRTTTAAEHRALPAMIAVAVTKSDNPEIAEEDYAAAMMAIQNLALAAVERGLGTHIKTGAIMNDPAARAAVGLSDNERIVAVVNLGEPAEMPPPKNRQPATAFTTWVP
ncbi:MAG TPA: nitroreductase [Gemmatimonadaceae bacterium]|jgi:nitroreductase|nr:nitroreductase [Gemmatimonadaceae bacterium]